MNFKKILATALSSVMVAATMAVPAFAAASTSVQASESQVVAGQEFTVSVPLEDNDSPVGAVNVQINYDAAAFTFVDAASDFVTATVSGIDGVATVTGETMSSTKTAGDLAKITFKVNAGATGGTKDFTLSYLNIADLEASVFLNLDSLTETDKTATVTIAAPEQLAAPVVTNEGKKATWEAVDNAKDYKVVLSKDGSEIYSTTTTATAFDFAKYVTATGRYSVVVTALQNGAMYLESNPSAAAEETYNVASTITPASKDYVKGSGGFDITMTLNGNTLTKINNGTADLTIDTDYTVTGNVVHINETDKLVAGTYTFTFSDNSMAEIAVTVKEAADSAIFVLSEKETTDYKTDVTDPNNGENEGLIVVTGAGDQPITNFTAVQFTLSNVADAGSTKLNYEIEAAPGFALLYDEATETYTINVKPENGIAPAVSEDTAGAGVVIGKLIYKGGYGKGTIKANDVIITVETSDNLYRKLNASTYNFLYEVKEKTEKLNVQVDFNLPVETDKESAYEKMTVSVASPRLGKLDFALGNDTVDYVNGDIKAAVVQDENQYSVTVEGLPAFDLYTVSISGDGYRDAKVNLNLNEEKTVMFWNNAKDSDAVYVKTATETEKMISKNFLAGDIIMDGNINLYDLSAVSSYYGKGMAAEMTADDAKYIQYDLNRDGKVDVFDITMLLDGWAE